MKAYSLSNCVCYEELIQQAIQTDYTFSKAPLKNETENISKEDNCDGSTVSKAPLVNETENYQKRKTVTMKQMKESLLWCGASVRNKHFNFVMLLNIFSI